jgi:hypothetical protein
MRELDWKGFDVLVVDDEQDNLDAFRFTFRKSFSRCTTPSAETPPWRCSAPSTRR